jgi:hypothetical protein
MKDERTGIRECHGCGGARHRGRHTAAGIRAHPGRTDMVSRQRPDHGTSRTGWACRSTHPRRDRPARASARGATRVLVRGALYRPQSRRLVACLVHPYQKKGRSAPAKYPWHVAHAHELPPPRGARAVLKAAFVSRPSRPRLPSSVSSQPRPGRPAQARSPRRWRHPVAAQDAPNGRCRDLLPELAQFALDAAIAPARVLACQTQDQLLALAGQRRPTVAAARAAPEGSPFATDQLPMPAEDGLRAAIADAGPGAGGREPDGGEEVPPTAGRPRSGRGQAGHRGAGGGGCRQGPGA